MELKDLQEIIDRNGSSLKQQVGLALSEEEAKNIIKHAVSEVFSLHVVSSSFNLEIKDRDIATIEAMHDTLLDEKVLGLNARSMKESRALTQRMYKALSKD